ncbi:LysR family transcriptional regulator [Streptomyces sp. AJS327]|uniref:LysR family transcriptional regulator n=1 Tax=Streptomyces sp. AJS327 TaxID=2545265 RepID=UPI0015DDD0BF|nr:LysR family transcriptional regulator [Streptomyces sp. AJS327]MBA0050921.1 LysR family transcriptional regulator [Streptomyces sp. AJS327]
MPLTSPQLSLLLAVRETGSLARAASLLGVTPPAISQQLTRLEKEVGSPLVERGARGAMLTRLGAALCEHAVRVAAELERAEETVEAFLGVHARRLRLGAFPSAAMSLLPQALATLRYRYPDAELSVVDLLSDEGPERVAGDELDLAITATYGQTLPDFEGVRYEHLMTDPLLAVLPDDHRLVRSPSTAPVRLADVAADAWVGGIAERPARRQIEAAAAAHDITPHVPFQTESLDVAQALAAAGVAVAFVPRLALWQARSTAPRPLVPELSREIYATLPSSSDHIGLAAELLKALRQVCAPYRRPR